MGNDGRIDRRAPLAAPRLGPLAIAGMAQLADQSRLLELRDGAEDLPHEFGGRRRVGEIDRRVDWDQFDAAGQQQLMAGELHREVAGEAASILDEHDADLVAVAELQQGDEAGALVNRIGTADGSVIEAGDDLVPAGGERIAPPPAPFSPGEAMSPLGLARGGCTGRDVAVRACLCDSGVSLSSVVPTTLIGSAAYRSDIGGRRAAPLCF